MVILKYLLSFLCVMLDFIGVIYAVNGPVPSKTKTEFIKGFTIDPQNGHLMETWAPEVVSGY